MIQTPFHLAADQVVRVLRCAGLDGPSTILDPEGADREIDRQLVWLRTLTHGTVRWTRQTYPAEGVLMLRPRAAYVDQWGNYSWYRVVDDALMAAGLVKADQYLTVLALPVLDTRPLVCSMSGFDLWADTGVVALTNGGAFAHEVGHLLGFRHTASQIGWPAVGTILGGSRAYREWMGNGYARPEWMSLPRLIALGLRDPVSAYVDVQSVMASRFVPLVPGELGLILRRPDGSQFVWELAADGVYCTYAPMPVDANLGPMDLAEVSWVPLAASGGHYGWRADGYVIERASGGILVTPSPSPPAPSPAPPPAMPPTVSITNPTKNQRIKAGQLVRFQAQSENATVLEWDVDGEAHEPQWKPIKGDKGAHTISVTARNGSLTAKDLVEVTVE